MISFSGIGFDALVAKKVTEFRRIKWLGRMTYAFGVIQVVKSFQPLTVRLSIDEKEFEYDQVWLVAIANTSNYAGGMEICPEAKVDDGLLDLCLVRDITPYQLLRWLPAVYKGKHVQHPSTVTHRGQVIRFQSSTHPPIHVDGEMIESSNITLTIDPKSLSIL